MELLTQENRIYDIEKLQIDRKYVEERFRYEDGEYSHKISLPSIDEISESHKYFHENVPYRGVLGYTPYFKEIFDSFETEIAGFILQRRRPYSSYGLHEDAFESHSMGENIKRFQIPIITNDNVWLCTTDYHFIPETIRLLYEKEGLNYGKSNMTTREVYDDRNENEFRKFKKRFNGHYKCYKLPTGIMYYFDIGKIHTLFNGGSTPKISLIIDVKVNDWVLKFIEGFSKK